MRAAAVFVASLLCLSEPGRAGAAAIVLDFEGLPGMNFWALSPIPADSELSDQFLDTLGVRFSSRRPYVPVVESGAGHAPSGINAIGGSTTDGLLTYAPENPIVAAFFDPCDPTEPATTDFVSMRTDLWGGSGMSVTLEAFDVDLNLIASQTLPDIGGDTLEVAVPGIHLVRFVGTADMGGAAIDDFTFNPVTPLTPHARLYPLQGVKMGVEAHWAWPDTSHAGDGYRLYAVLVKEDLDSTAPGRGARGSNPSATRECETAEHQLASCIDPDAFDAATPWLLFLQVVGVCASTEGPN